MRSLENPRLAFEPAVLGLRDVVRARGEDVEDEASAREEQAVRRGQHPQPVLVRVHVQQRAERADHERHAFGHRWLAQVADTKVELHPGERGSPRADLEHAAGGVDADHPDDPFPWRHYEADMILTCVRWIWICRSVIGTWSS